MYRIFTAIEDGGEPRQVELDVLNGELSIALARARVLPALHGLEWGWADDAQALDRMLWPVARSAAELLTSPELRGVRECEKEACTWVFLDTSKNRRRRWCEMSSCGNRAKASRHYARRKQASG